MSDPFALFGEAYERATAREPFEANAMALATVDANGHPSVRIVLLKSFDERGFVFHTNQASRKGRELDGQRRAAFCIHWPKGEEQVRVEGIVERASEAENDRYFASRPRGSQIGSWASLQSEELASRDVLVARVAEMEARFAGQPVPRPPHWGGYRIVPSMIELWKGHADRLHDRRVFRRGLGPPPTAWTELRLFP